MAMDTVSEFFLLRTAGRLRPDVREPERLRRTLHAAGQKRAAAEALWSSGHNAEAIHLLRQALQRARDATLAATARDRFEDALAALELPASLAAELEALLRAAPPELDEELAAEHTTWFGDALAAHATLTRAADYVTLGPPGRRRRQLARWSAALGSAALLSVVGTWLYKNHQRAHVEASGSFDDNPRFGPENAVDDNPRTEWVLPDRRGGWLDIYLERPTTIRGVKLLNGHNPPYNDRAARTFRVIAYDRDRRPTSAQGTFAEFADAPRWKTLELRATNVVRVRVEVHNYFRRGAAIAEVKILR